MGDWESIFGAGVSAESVISGFNAEYFAEGQETEQEGWVLGEADFLAFRSDPDLKADLLERIRRLSASNVLGFKEGELEKALQNDCKEFEGFDATCTIPSELIHLIELICRDLQGFRHYRDSAIDWPVECFSAIQAGTNLYGVAPKMAAQLADMSQNLFDREKRLYRGKGTRQTCEPAIVVINARDRGVIVQDSLTEDALEIARTVLRDAYQEWTYVFPEDFAVAIVESAADPAKDGVMRSMRLAAEARLMVSGDASYEDNLWEFAKELLVIIRDAPTRRVEIINLNDFGTLGSPAEADNRDHFLNDPDEQFIY